MLVVRSAGSGEVLAEFDGDEFQRMVQLRGHVVLALKFELQHQGFGSRFRQRLLNDSGEMQDDEMLVPPLDLTLVQMNFCPSDKVEEDAFIDACRENRLEEVERRLKKPQDPNITMPGGWTAMHLAASNGRSDVLRLLLEADAACDEPVAASAGFTPLRLAAAHGHLEAVHLLLQAGAAKEVSMAFHCAAGAGHLEIATLLLDKGAKCDEATPDGFTPLNSAAMCGQVEVVRFLLAAGASCDRATAHGITPLIWALRNGHVEVVRLLLAAGATCDFTFENGRSALLFAAENGHWEVVRLLLECGVAYVQKLIIFCCFFWVVDFCSFMF